MQADDVPSSVRKAWTTAWPAIAGVGTLSGFVQVFQAVKDGESSVLFTSIAGICALVVGGAAVNLIRQKRAARQDHTLDEAAEPGEAPSRSRHGNRFQFIVITCIALTTLSFVATAASVLYAATASQRPSVQVDDATRASTSSQTADSPSAAPSPARSAAPEAGCQDVADRPGVVRPAVTPAGARSGLTFCPVLINNGRLPITGPFPLAGQVLGPIEKREQVLILTYGDPGSCDALGNPPTAGRFHQTAAFDSPSGEWSLTDKLGYEEAVTIERHYEFLTGSPDSIAAIKNDGANWRSANPERQDDYPGIRSLPADVEVLATFTVPAGEYPGAEPCRRA